jgi:hypothetical protein
MIANVIKKGYLVSDSEHLQPTNDYNIANEAIQKSLKNNQEIVIYLSTEIEIVASLYVTMRGDQPWVYDYDYESYMERFIERIISPMVY